MLEADEISRILVSSAGVAVMVYGVWCAGRDRATKAIVKRSHDISERHYKTMEELEECKLESIKMRAELKILRK